MDGCTNRSTALNVVASWLLTSRNTVECTRATVVYEPMLKPEVQHKLLKYRDVDN